MINNCTNFFIDNYPEEQKTVSIIDYMDFQTQGYFSDFSLYRIYKYNHIRTKMSKMEYSYIVVILSESLSGGMDPLRLFKLRSLKCECHH